MTYSFKTYVMEVEGHVFWVVESEELKGCIAQGDTLEEALKEFQENEKVWLETAKEVGISIPSPKVKRVQEFSGKFTVRVGKYVHEQASSQARKSGISLNQYVTDAINYKLGFDNAVDKMLEEHQKNYTNTITQIYSNAIRGLRNTMQSNSDGGAEDDFVKYVGISRRPVRYC